MSIEGRKASLLFRVKQFGGPLNEPALLAQFLAQVEHESGGYRYVREIWGPTKAQKGYEGRADLGNTQPGDGKRFMGRDLLQVTGRANHRALTVWVRKTFGQGPDFEADPEALESPEWLGIGAIWYFLTRKDLLRFCRDGNIEMVTRRVNGGLNGYADRLHRYDRIALELLGYDSIKQFQEDRRLVTDGISGPKTRAAMHDLMTTRAANLSATKAPPLAPSKPTAEPAPAKPAKPRTGPALVAGGIVAVIYAASDTLAEWWQAFLNLF
jgi:putative chitinase